MFKKIIFISTLFLMFTKNAHSFEKIVIWGHKLHTHTHSYIHNAFYIAFKHLGYNVYWFDDSDDVSQFDFSDTLFLTEGQVDIKIPLRDDCEYLLHNCFSSKYNSLFLKGRCFQFLVYRTSRVNKPHQIEVEPCIFFDYQRRAIFMPWGTDLLPYEIDAIKKKVPRIQKTRKMLKTIYWVGTLGGGQFSNICQVRPFIEAAKECGISFIHKDPWARGLSVKENILLTQRSYIAPAIVGTWQKEIGYIPCRIFKNISYGQMGVTNSPIVAHLFQNKIIYNPDTYALFFEAQKRIKSMKLQELYDLMDFVRDKHTYINRIQAIFHFMRWAKGKDLHHSGPIPFELEFQD